MSYVPGAQDGLFLGKAEKLACGTSTVRRFAVHSFVSVSILPHSMPPLKRLLGLSQNWDNRVVRRVLAADESRCIGSVLQARFPELSRPGHCAIRWDRSGREAVARPSSRRDWTSSSRTTETPIARCTPFDSRRRITRSTMASRNAERRESVTRGTGNVFADLGLPDAAERQAKLRLAYALNQVLVGRKLSQADAARVLGITQPKVSALRNYKLAGFSVERLMNLLTALDQDVEIVIRRKPRSRKTGRISVVAA